MPGAALGPRGRECPFLPSLPPHRQDGPREQGLEVSPGSARGVTRSHSPPSPGPYELKGAFPPARVGGQGAQTPQPLGRSGGRANSPLACGNGGCPPATPIARQPARSRRGVVHQLGRSSDEGPPQANSALTAESPPGLQLSGSTWMRPGPRRAAGRQP